MFPKKFSGKTTMEVPPKGPSRPELSKKNNREIPWDRLGKYGACDHEVVKGQRGGQGVVRKGEEDIKKSALVCTNLQTERWRRELSWTRRRRPNR